MTNRRDDDNDQALDARKEGDGPQRAVAGECVCTRCGGTGREVWRDPPMRGQRPRRFEITCGACGGTGTVIDA